MTRRSSFAAHRWYLAALLVQACASPAARPPVTRAWLPLAEPCEVIDENGSMHPRYRGSGTATVHGFVSVDVGSPLGIHVALRDGVRIVGTDRTYGASVWGAGYVRRGTGMYMFTGVRPGTYELVFSLGGQEIARETVVVEDRPDNRRESSLRISGIHRTPRCA